MRGPSSELTINCSGGLEADVNRYDPTYRRWLAESIAVLRMERQRSSDTDLLRFPLPTDWGVDIYLKDEAGHQTGSLKHRIARSLFVHGLCNGWILPGRPIVEASSGSTAISEAYFASLIGLPFIAVVSRATSTTKVRMIEFYGGRCHFVDDPADVYETAAQVADDVGGHYMDQFANASLATDWRGNENIGASIFEQISLERFPEPKWIVATAGTGGTSATLSRYIRYRGALTGVCVADPENSAYFPAWRANDLTITIDRPSRIEGIGRQRVESSFVASAVERMLRVPDAAAIASIQVLNSLMGRRAGASTGTGLWAALLIASEMKSAGESGSIVSVICDSGERYPDKYYSREWLESENIDPGPFKTRIENFVKRGNSMRSSH